MANIALWAVPCVPSSPCILSPAMTCQVSKNPPVRWQKNEVPCPSNSHELCEPPAPALLLLAAAALPLQLPKPEPLKVKYRGTREVENGGWEGAILRDLKENYFYK